MTYGLNGRTFAALLAACVLLQVPAASAKTSSFAKDFEKGPFRLRLEAAFMLPDEEALKAAALDVSGATRMYEDAMRYGQDLADLKSAAKEAARQKVRRFTLPFSRLLNLRPNIDAVEEKVREVPDTAIDAFTNTIRDEYREHYFAPFEARLDSARSSAEAMFAQRLGIAPKDGLQTFRVGLLGTARIDYSERWLWETPKTSVERDVAGLSIKATVTPDPGAQLRYEVNPEVSIEVHTGGGADEAIMSAARDVIGPASKTAKTMAKAIGAAPAESEPVGEAVAELQKQAKATLPITAGDEDTGRADGALLKANRVFLDGRASAGFMTGAMAEDGRFAGAVAEGALAYRKNGHDVMAGVSLREFGEASDDDRSASDSATGREVRFQAFYNAPLDDKRSFSAGLIHRFDTDENGHSDSESIAITRFRVTF